MIDTSGHLRRYRQECGYLDQKNYITVNCCGYQKFITKDFTSERTDGRLDYQIIYISKGKGYYKIADQMVCVPEGNIVVFKPGEEQCYNYYYKEQPEVYWVHFTGYGARECLIEAELAGNAVFYIGFSETAIDLYKRIMYELQIKRSMHDKMAGALLLELISYLSRKIHEYSSGSNRTKDANLQKVIGYIHRNYSSKLRVKELADMCNLSTYWFIHNFKNLTGLPPIEYLTAVRIDKARELLTNSSMNIGEVGNFVGYENPLYFSRIFKTQTGLSPSDFKKQYKSVLENYLINTSRS